MPYLLPGQIAQHAARAGFREGDLVTSVAVAMGTSLGSTDAPGGLWGLPGAPRGDDPAANAGKAFERWKAGGWGQWPAYTSKRYLLFMPAAAAGAAAADVIEIIKDPKEAVQGAAAAIPDLPGAGLIDAAGDAVAMAGRTAAWFANRQNWVRIAQVVIGGAVVVAAVVKLSGTQETLTGLIGSAAGKLKGAKK